MSVTKGSRPQAAGKTVAKWRAKMGVNTPKAQRVLKVVSGNVFNRTEAKIPSSASGSIN